jgi:uncharacterized membrane protein YccC
MEREEQAKQEQQRRTEMEQARTIQERSKRQVLERTESEKTEFLKRIKNQRQRFDQRLETAEPPREPSIIPGSSVIPGSAAAIRPLPKKSSPLERLGVRIAIFVLILAFVVGLILVLYWFFKYRGPSELPPLPQ